MEYILKLCINELIIKYGKPQIYLTGKSNEDIINEFKRLEVKVLSVDEIEKL